MEICCIIIKYIPIRPKSIQPILQSVNCFGRDNMIMKMDVYILFNMVVARLVPCPAAYL